MSDHDSHATTPARPTEPQEATRPRRGGEELACDPATLNKWRNEVLRLRGVVADHEAEAKNMIWFLKIGGALAVPTVFYHLAMPLAVFGFALIGYFTGHYFVRGHLAERRENLQSAESELARRRGLAGLPEQDETLLPPKGTEDEATPAKENGDDAQVEV